MSTTTTGSVFFDATLEAQRRAHFAEVMLREVDAAGLSGMLAAVTSVVQDWALVAHTADDASGSVLDRCAAALDSARAQASKRDVAAVLRDGEVAIAAAIKTGDHADRASVLRSTSARWTAALTDRKVKRSDKSAASAEAEQVSRRPRGGRRGK